VRSAGTRQPILHKGWSWKTVVKPLAFFVTPLACALPLLVFLVGTLALVIAGAPAVEGMILVAMLGIFPGMALARDREAYTEQVFFADGQSHDDSPIVWLAFGRELFRNAGCLPLGGSDRLARLEGKSHRSPVCGRRVYLFVLVRGLRGTGLGTVVGFTPSCTRPESFWEVIPGHHGSILSGAALGDNLAPVSDTTDRLRGDPGTGRGQWVATRLKYVLLAAAISTILFFVFGGRQSAIQSRRSRGCSKPRPILKACRC